MQANTLAMKRLAKLGDAQHVQATSRQLYIQ